MATFSRDEDRIPIKSSPDPSKSRSVCDASAANLLMQIRRIAMDELIGENPCEPLSIYDGVPSTPLATPPREFFLRGRKDTVEQVSNADKSCSERRSRTVSIESPINHGTNNPLSLIPLLQNNTLMLGDYDDDVCADDSKSSIRTQSLKMPSFLVSPDTTKMSRKEEPEDFSLDHVPALPFHKKFVGQTLPEGVKRKDVLRPKYSWKSFPELEAYLVDNREQYLQYSNSLNYTKAQKHYNNSLTQGLIELAGKKGYVFDGFTFAAVRDRIRCFYKSFVQAAKKKKRNKQRGRSVTF